MNYSNVFWLLSLSFLGLVSCDVQQSSPPSEVALTPRFSADSSGLPETNLVTARLRTSTGLDTTVSATYSPGGFIELGSLPPLTPFHLEMTGWEVTGATRRAVWWSAARDTSGSNLTHVVSMPVPTKSASPASVFTSADSIHFGDTLILPAGSFATFDESDPRDTATAIALTGTLSLDSNDLVRIASRLPADPATGRPELWSNVMDIRPTIDPLDTLAMLDSLSIRWEERTNLATFLFPTFGRFDPEILGYIDTLRFEYDLTIPLVISVKPRSPRCTVLVEGLSTNGSRSISVAMPADSTFRVVTRNHGWSKSYSIRLVTKNLGRPTKRLDKLAATTAGLRMSALDDKFWVISIPFDQSIFSIIPTFPPTMRLQFGAGLWKSGDTIPLSAPLDTTFSFLVVDSLGDPKPAGPYSLQVIHAPRTMTFRDTTWGVPWREVSYDTLLDTRNGRKYRTVMVGQSRWMAENLNFRRDSSFCPGVSDTCSKYGRWYRWAAAADTTPAFDSTGLATTTPLKGICPSGWHLPSETEWRNLFDLLGTSKSAKLLHSVGSSWYQGGGEDSVGFRALPGGYRYLDRGYPSFFNTRDQTSDAYFWTATQNSLDATRAVSIHISGSAPAVDIMTTSPKSNAYNVRCVEDAAP
jgi:uncharacterized protein (TIGR02145 family)